MFIWFKRMCAGLLVLSAAQFSPTPVKAQEDRVSSLSRETPSLAQVKLLEKSRRKELSVWRPFLASDSPQVRKAALRGVGQAKTVAAMSHLRNALNDPNPEIQRIALFSLIQLEELDAERLQASVQASTALDDQAHKVRLMGLLDGEFDATFLNDLLNHRALEIQHAFLLALRQRKHLFPKAPDLVKPSQLVALLATAPPTLKIAIMKLVRVSSFANGQWRNELQNVCKTAELIALQDECAEFSSQVDSTQSGINQVVHANQVWTSQVAQARAALSRKDGSALERQMRTHLAGLRAGTVALETSSFYGVIAPIQSAISFAPHEGLKSAATAVYRAIKLEGVSVKGATGALGLSLSHLHCAAAAVVDRNTERVRMTRKCGAEDYDQPLRDMWMVRAVMQWSVKKRNKWFKKRFSKLTARAQILALELGEPIGASFLEPLLMSALKSDTAAVAGSAARIIGNLQLRGLEAEMVSAYRRTISQREFSVVEAVIAALAKLSYDTAEALFLRHREDPHSGIRQAALMGLEAIEQKRLHQSHLNRLDTMQLAQRGFEPPPPEVLNAKNLDQSIVTTPMHLQFEVRTSKNSFVLALEPDWALLAVKKVASLVGQSFFDGQTITVLGNGDVIVGDPSGLGWDGKGRNVPDEVSPIEIVEGSIILHRSGRDTATSRLLITRNERPELYGQVNVVGRIISGNEGLNALVEGDRIIEVQPRLSSGNPEK